MAFSRKSKSERGGVVVSHAGRQHAYRTAVALQAAGALNLFLTSAYYKRDIYPDRLATFIPRLDEWLKRRHQPGLDPLKVRRFPMLEFGEVAYRSMKGSDRLANKLVRARDLRFDRAVSALLPGLNASVFWGFQGSPL